MGKAMIRAATYSDIPRLVQLGAMLHEASSYAAMQFDYAKVSDFLAALIAHQNGGVVFVAERDGNVIGGFAGAVAPHWFSQDKVAFDYSIFLEPGKRHGITATKLVMAFVEYAKQMGAVQINLGITTDINVEATARFYESLGLRQSGVLFSMGVKHGH